MNRAASPAFVARELDMGRDDWVFVGVRLFGLYLLVETGTIVVRALMHPWLFDVGEWGHELLSAVPEVLTRGIAGTTTLFGAPWIVSSLRIRDRRAPPER